MALVDWSERLLTNVKQCDDQHKKLVNLVNDLHTAMTGGKGKEILGKILAELVSYTDYHFKTEEQLFAKYGYPEAQKHKLEHDELTRKAKDLKERFDKGQVTISIEVMNFLSNWLKDHILGSDKKYGPFLNSKGVF